MRKTTSYTTTQIIAKEGWNPSVLAFVVFLITYALSWMPWFFFFVFIITLLSYRNPERIQEEDDVHAIVSPIDGVIKDISKVSLKDGEEVLRIVIQKSLFNVGVLRAPCAMHIEEEKKRFGLPISYNASFFHTLSARKILVCKAQDYLFRLVLNQGQYAREMSVYPTGGTFKSAQRLGFLYEGEVVLLLPLNVRVKVALQSHVQAGATTIGYFSYKDKNDTK